MTIYWHIVREIDIYDILLRSYFEFNDINLNLNVITRIHVYSIST